MAEMAAAEKFVELITQIVSSQKDMALAQKKTTDLLEKAVDRINALEKRISKLEQLRQEVLK